MTDLVLDSGLDSLLNQFSVPMFALDRSAPKDEFQYVCINRALEVAGARPAADVVGRSVHQLLPKLEADIVHRRYAECAETRKDVRFRDQFTTDGHPVIWDTTLQHVALKDGSDRLVGTCIRLSEERDHTGKAPALEDIQYFSSMADLQLQNLISTFEIFRDKDLFSIQNEQHIDKLTGMCRTVQRAVEDIKKVVRTTTETAPPVRRSVPAVQAGIAKRPTHFAGSDTVEALFSDVAEDLRRCS